MVYFYLYEGLQEKFMTLPSVCRSVFFYPNDGSQLAAQAPLAAIIADVIDENHINVAAFTPNGVPLHEPPTNVVLLGPDEEIPSEGPYCMWPPLLAVGTYKNNCDYPAGVITDCFTGTCKPIAPEGDVGGEESSTVVAGHVISDEEVKTLASNSEPTTSDGQDDGVPDRPENGTITEDEVPGEPPQEVVDDVPEPPGESQDVAKEPDDDVNQDVIDGPGDENPKNE